VMYIRDHPEARTHVGRIAHASQHERNALPPVPDSGYLSHERTLSGWLAPDVREERMQVGEKRLEIRDHHRRILDRSAVDPDDRHAIRISGLAPMQPHAVRESLLRQLAFIETKVK